MFFEPLFLFVSRKMFIFAATNSTNARSFPPMLDSLKWTYIFDNTLDGLLSAVFDSFALHQQPVVLLAERQRAGEHGAGASEQLPLFATEPHRVATDGTKAARVWKGLEKHLSPAGLRIIALSWLSEERALNQPLFNYICKVFLQPKDAPSIEHNASDKRTPVLELKVLCNLEMDTGAIPLLPEPWSWFYKPIKENLVDGHSFEEDGTNL